MNRFLLFLKKTYVAAFFVLLQAFAIHHYANSTSYTKAKMLTVSNAAVGSFYGLFADIGSYFGLRAENRALIGEVVRLQDRLAAFQVDSGRNVTMIPEGELNPYIYGAARVINNSISRRENYITLNRGLRDGVEANMAVLSGEGYVAGYVLACSDKYAVCMSVLNTGFRTSGKVKGADFFGSVYWDGLDHTHVILTEIPKYAVLHKGDTIVTTDYSSIFPPEMMIGTVVDWELNNATFYDVRVRLATPMSRLRNVLLVRHTDAAERSALEQDAAAMSRR